MPLQTYWIQTVWGWNTNGTSDWFLPTPPGIIPPNNTGVRAYCASTYYEEFQDQASSIGEIFSFKQNGVLHQGPFVSIALGPGVTDITAHVQATNARVKYLLIVDIFV